MDRSSIGLGDFDQSLHSVQSPPCSEALITTHVTPSRLLTLRGKHESLISNSSLDVSSVQFSFSPSGDAEPSSLYQANLHGPVLGHWFLCEQNGTSLIKHLPFQYLMLAQNNFFKIYMYIYLYSRYRYVRFFIQFRLQQKKIEKNSTVHQYRKDGLDYGP